MRALAGSIVRRAVHRSSWGSGGAATVTALLAGIIAVRVGANVLMAVDISLRGGTVAAGQFAAVHGLFLLSACTWTAPRRAAAVRSALSVPALHPHPAFTRMCVTRAVAGRAAYVVPVLVALAFAVVAALVEAPLQNALLAGVIGVSALLPLLVSRMGTVLRLGPDQLGTVELVGLLLLLAANPDLAPGDGAVATVLFSRTLPAGLPARAGLMAIAGLLPLLPMAVFRGYESLARIAVRRTPRRVLLTWYRRLCVAPWMVIFACMTPIVVSGSLAGDSRRWIGLTVGTGLLGWLVVVVGTIDQTLEYRWNRPVARRGRARLLVPVMLVHLALTAAVVVPALIR